MRGIMIILAVVSLALTNLGCIAVIGNRGTAELGAHRQAVAMGDGIYVVNLADGSVSRIDQAAIETAETFVPHVDWDDDK